MTGDRDAELRRVLVHGPAPTTVVIVDYDPTWPERFVALAEGLRDRLGERALRVEHVGSTAVPGLAAKDRIDLCVTVADPDEESAYLADVLGLGWLPAVTEAGHRCLRWSGAWDANLHVYADDSPEVTDYLLLRDWLRGHEADRDRYATLKRELAGRGEWADINDYADAKGPLIRELLDHARHARGSSEGTRS